MRSYLYVPGNRPQMLTSALSRGADALIVDLEDAVPPAEKPAAREAVARWLRTLRRTRRSTSASTRATTASTTRGRWSAPRCAG